MCGAILTGVSAGVWVLRSHALRRNSGIWAFAAALIFLGACNSDPNSESDEVGPALSFASVAFGRGFAAALSTTARSPAGVTTTPVKPMRPRANSPRSWREPVTRVRWRLGGSAACWGSDGSWQASPPDEKFVSLSTSGWTSCGITADAAVICWGNSYYDRGAPPTEGAVDCWGAVPRAPGGVDFEPFPQAFAEQRAKATFGF